MSEDKLNVPASLRESTAESREIVTLVRATAILEGKVDRLQGDVQQLRVDMKSNYMKSDEISSEISKELHVVDKKLKRIDSLGSC